ncbi:pyruvate kinase, partial [Achromatium sp. WMS2]
MLRRTKIVATLGPSTDDPKVLDGLIQAGVDVVRINLSHDSHQAHQKRVDLVRQRAKLANREVGILADLQGPKIRIGCFAEAIINLEVGAAFCLDAECPLDSGTQERVGLTYKNLVKDVRRGDTLLLDDGAIQLWVDEVRGQQVCCRVVIGGKLSNHKGINKLGGGLSAPALTCKDRADLRFAAGIGADYVAVSFVRNETDIIDTRRLLQDLGCNSGICAKIERTEALEHIIPIIRVADAVMIARGDLGVEIGDAKLPAAQKRIIKLALEMNAVVITATQMMQSMINNPMPTRAEVMDVANAVMDGSDAVMLSAETSVG